MSNPLEFRHGPLLDDPDPCFERRRTMDVQRAVRNVDAAWTAHEALAEQPRHIAAKVSAAENAAAINLTDAELKEELARLRPHCLCPTCKTKITAFQSAWNLARTRLTNAQLARSVTQMSVGAAQRQWNEFINLSLGERLMTAEDYEVQAATDAFARANEALQSIAIEELIDLS
jgi:hypothetical protein